MFQIKVVPRTSAGPEFHSLLASADVLLHPFPFGGSKTAADGLSLGEIHTTTHIFREMISPKRRESIRVVIGQVSQSHIFDAL